MALYDIHFVDHAGNVIDALEVERDTDEAAIEEARRIYVPGIGHGFDVWQGRRLVQRHRRK